MNNYKIVIDAGHGRYSYPQNNKTMLKSYNTRLC